MASFENVYHDFPRLAKQSGFHFQLHRGEVNWLEIENLDLNEITEKGNYKLLEQNLSNVINCNVDKEYDLKILNKNFIKLFKLAQLGVDYLSYFEVYLDKCVVLLQEQLMSLKEEYNLLKEKELSKGSKKNKTLSYQCEKCEKVFISDVYLRFHDKRRHKTLDNSDRSPKNCISNENKIEEKQVISISTQTLFPNETTVSQKEESRKSLIKIEKLEEELQELKERLKKAETALTVKSEGSKSNELACTNTPDAKPYNPLLFFLPFFWLQSKNDNDQIHPECQSLKSEIIHSNPTILPVGESEISNEPEPQNNQLNVEFENKFEEKSELAKAEITLDSTIESFKQPLTKDQNVETENLNKPLPPPRKFKKKPLTQKTSEFSETPKSNLSEKESLNFSEVNENISEKKLNEELKTSLGEENILETTEESQKSLNMINKSEVNSMESLKCDKSVSSEPQFKYFIQKIVSKSTPNFLKLGTDLKKSFYNRFDSVLINKKRESDNVNLKAAVVEGINDSLRQLGVDPEWSGIPKKTMKQKLNILKHRRRVLSMANPMYSVVRQNVEGKIFQKIKSKMAKTTNSDIKLNKQSPVKGYVTESSSVDPVISLVKNETSFTSDVNTDSESTISDTERNLTVLQKPVFVKESSSEPEAVVQTKKEEEFDFSVFQVGKCLNTPDVKKQVSNYKTNYCATDSDSDRDFFDNFDNRNSKTYSNLNHQNKDNADNINLSETRLEFFRTESQSIVNGGEEQTRVLTNGQKNLFFASYPSGMENLSDSPTDDLWPLNSDWEDLYSNKTNEKFLQ